MTTATKERASEPAATDQVRAAVSRAIAQPKEPAPVGRVFGEFGQEVELGRQVYHLARFTAAGIRQIGNLIGNLLNGVYLPDATIGECVAEWVIVGDQFARLQQAFGLILAEGDGIPADLAMQCTTEEIAGCIDLFYAQSGLRFMERMQKNALAAQAEAMEAEAMERIRETVGEMLEAAKAEIQPKPGNAPSTTANGSTS